MHHTHVWDTSWAYQEWPGTKGTFVIVHGRGGSSQSWVGVAEILQREGYRVIVPDLPWFGETPLTHTYTLNDYARWLAHFLENLKIKNYILLGHSHGGRMSIHGVASHILSPAHLILVNSAGIPRQKSFFHRMIGPFLQYGKRILQLPGVRSLRPLIYKILGWHDRLALKDPHLKETFVAMIAADLQQQMPAITIPTLIIRGSEDTYTPLADGKKIAALIPQSHFVILYGQRHGIHLHAPQLLVSTILDGLN